jgi:hypothetical protein
VHLEYGLRNIETNCAPLSVQAGELMTKKAPVRDSIQLESPEWLPSALRAAAEDQFAAAMKEGASLDIQNRLRRLYCSSRHEKSMERTSRL